MRMLNISPSPWSNISSAEVRESIQLKMAAKGNWPVEVSFTCCNKLRWVFMLLTNLSFPSFNISIANWGDNPFCVSLVCTLISVFKSPKGNNELGRKGRLRTTIYMVSSAPGIRSYNKVIGQTIKTGKSWSNPFNNKAISIRKPAPRLQ